MAINKLDNGYSDYIRQIRMEESKKAQDRRQVMIEEQKRMEEKRLERIKKEPRTGEKNIDTYA